MKNSIHAYGGGKVSSEGSWFGKSTIYGVDGEHNTAYMTRYWIGRLRLHVFHRGDQDPDCHDHPWDFWTFPLTSYVEEVAVPPSYPNVCEICQEPDGCRYCELSGEMNPCKVVRQVVPAWRWTFRPATHCHRVLAPWSGYHEHTDGGGRTHAYSNGSHIPIPPYQPQIVKPHYDHWDMQVFPKIVTIVWRSPSKRKWGFLKNREGQWCWTPWKEYVFGGGKNAPCS